MNDFKRNDRFGGKGRDSDQGPRQMFKATCATCGKPCEVPFRPDGSRPIYCREHFGGKPAGPSQSRDFRPQSQAPAQPRQQSPDPRIDELKRLIEKLTLKVEQALLQVAVSKAQATVKPAPAKAKKPAKTSKKR